MTARGVKAEEVLAYVAGYIDRHGYSPSIRDICDGVDLSSSSTVWYHLEGLRLEGRVAWLDKTPRTLRIVHRPAGAVPQDTSSVPTPPPSPPTGNPLAIPNMKAGDWQTPVRSEPQKRDRAGAGNAPRSAAVPLDEKECQR